MLIKRLQGVWTYLQPDRLLNPLNPEYALTWDGSVLEAEPSLGPTATVVDVPDSTQERIVVRYLGVFWRARVHRRTLSLVIGDEVRVISRQGNVLIVDRVLLSPREKA